MIPSSLEQALTDRRLQGAPFAVYAWCLRNLDSIEERPVKIIAVAHALHLKKDTVIGALRCLVETRYIAKGQRPHGLPRHYRVLPPPPIEHKARAA